MSSGDGTIRPPLSSRENSDETAISHSDCGLHSHTPLTTTVRSLFSLSAFRACDSFLQSSSPVQEWASSMRCLEQKWPAQKLQSPTMRWAASLHSLKLQRGLRGGIVVGWCGRGFGEREKDIEVLLRKREREIGSRSSRRDAEV